MAVDLTEFKAAFPQWADCDDSALTFWADLAACMFCAPAGCPALAEKIPFLMLAHVLEVNGVSCSAGAPAVGDACECEDDALTQILNGGSKISSASLDGLAVSFDNSGVNTLTTTVGAGSAFRAWLAMTGHGRMVAALLSQMGKGPIMAIGKRRVAGVYGDDHPLIHGRIPGHL